MTEQKTADACGASLSDAVLDGVCDWTEDENGMWNTGCSGMFEITEGTPMLNDMKFCCYCGKSLNQVDYVWPDDDAA